MKKFLLTALVAVVSLTANAQFWAGGSIGAGTSKTTFDGEDLEKANTVSINPTVGYSISDNLDVALELAYAHGDSDSKNINAFGFRPFVRYTFVKSGNFKVFADGGFGYANIHTSGVEDNTNNWEIFIRPGISYDLTKKVYLTATVGDLNYQFSKTGDLKTNAFNLDLDSNVSFGVNVRL